MVFSGLVIAWRRATCPTSRSLVLGLTATTEVVSRLPSAFSSTVGSPASMIATTELVVPRSIPSTFAIVPYLFVTFLCVGRPGAATGCICVVSVRPCIGLLQCPESCERGVQGRRYAASERRYVGCLLESGGDLAQ